MSKKADLHKLLEYLLRIIDVTKEITPIIIISSNKDKICIL